MSAKCSEGCDVCYECPKGTYSFNGFDECKACPPGEVSLAVAGLYTSCEKCEAGKYRSSDIDECRVCDSGKYAGVGASVCTNCASGKISKATFDGCDDCEKGKYSASGSSSCSPCLAGKYSDQVGSSNCLSCVAGKYTDTINSESCQDCDSGTYSVGGSESCSNCAAGKSSEAGKSTCLDCGLGQMSVAGGNCVKCENGKYAAFAASTSCLPCLKGYYCHERTTESSGSSKAAEHKCGELTNGLEQNFPAAFYCPEGSFEPKDVTQGYYSAPLDGLEVTREEQRECEADKYCYNGNPEPFLAWEVDSSSGAVVGCPSELVVQEENDLSGSTSLNEPNQLFKIGKNPTIDNGNNLKVKLDIGGNAMITYKIQAMRKHESDIACTLSKDKISISPSGLTADGSMTIQNEEGVSKLDYEDCKHGVDLEVVAVADFSDSECYPGSGTPCPEVDSTVCNVHLKITNKNEPPVWDLPQTSDPDGKCYMKEILFKVKEANAVSRTREFMEFGSPLEDCVTDPDEADSTTFSVNETDVSNPGNKLFDIKNCGGILFIREGAEDLIKYDMKFKNDPDANRPDNTYNVAVTAKDDEGQEAKLVVQVEIENENDAPTWTTEAIPTLKIKENVKLDEFGIDSDERKVVASDGTGLKDLAEDLDLDDLTFSFEDENDKDSMLFTIDSEGNLRSNAVFDREAGDYTFKLYFKVTDNNETTIPPRSPPIFIEIEDVNDPPVFNNGEDGQPRTSKSYTFPETVSGELEPSRTTKTGDEIADLTKLASDQDVDECFGTEVESLRYKLETLDGGTSEDFELETVLPSGFCTSCEPGACDARVILKVKRRGLLMQVLLMGNHSTLKAMKLIRTSN